MPMIDKKAFTEKAAQARDKHFEIIKHIEEYRYILGDLETIANGSSASTKKTIPGELVSLSHHFILNGLLNTLNAVAEGVRRAQMRVQDEE